MDLLQLKYFCHAAKEENFSRTAQKFSVPASNISQTVKRLETELGIKLFERSANRVVLSDKGRKFYSQVSLALSDIDDAVNDVKTNDKETVREIRIKMCTNRRIVTLAIEKFKNMYSDVNFFLSHNYSDKGDFDFIISDLPPENSYTEGELLINEKFVVAMKKTNPLVNVKNIAQLKEMRFVVMPESSSHMRCVREICKLAGFEPNVAITCDEPFYVRRYIEIGLGIGFVPSFSWSGQFSDDVALLDICRYTRDTYLYCNPERIKLPELKMFKEILMNICND